MCCEGCGTTFDASAAVKHGRTQKFCNRKCADEHASRGKHSVAEEAAETERFITRFRELVPASVEQAYYAQRRVPVYCSPITAV